MNLTLMDLHLLAGADYVKSIEFRVTQKNFKNLGSPSMAEPLFVRWENSNYRYNFAVPGLPKFLKFF